MNMKRILPVAALAAVFAAPAFADETITIYYSPTCPHCHHARDFISSDLIYTYPSLTVEEVDVSNQANYPRFAEAVKSCGYDSGGVPIAIVNGKCFQGFGAPENTGVEFRAALDAKLTPEEKAAHDAAVAAMAANPDGYRAANASRNGAIRQAAPAQTADAQKKNNGSNIYFWGILGVLIIGLGFVLFSKKKK